MKQNKNEINNIYVFVQFVLFVALTILLIMSAFIDIMPVVQIVMGILLVVIAYNNFYVFNNKKGYLIIYILFGVISVALGILRML